MHKDEFEEILARYKSGTCSEEEKALVENWIMLGEFSELDLSYRDLKKDISEIDGGLPLVSQYKSLSLWPRISAAAVILVTIGIGWYFYAPKKEYKMIKATVAKEIPPGRNKAILTLADGKKIALDDASKGQLAEQSGIKITKTDDGQLTYTVSNSSAQASNTLYNTIETPNGGQYKIILPDGSKVWLNAASSLKYPTIFTGNKRRIELKGEAYFEVKHNKIPFSVKTTSQEVEVLGTHFNIKSYSDEPSTKTTLLEGSIRVSATSGSNSKLLIPGQQAVQQANNIQVSPVDADLAVAWKNGLFIFDDEPIETVMRSLARWYEVDVIYDKGVDKGRLFGGSVSRYTNFSKVLEKLELTGGIHFKIDGRRITVMK